MRKHLISGISLLVFLTLGFIVYSKTDKLKLDQVHEEKQEENIDDPVVTLTFSPTPTPALSERNQTESTARENETTIDDGSDNFWKPTENQDSPQPISSYVYDSYYPIILSFSDSKGGSTKHSEYNQFSQGSSITGITLRVGDVIRWKTEANDPLNRQILYNFHSNSQRFTDLFGRENGQYKYTTNSEIEFTITEEDIKEVGEAFSVVLRIKSEKENYRVGSGYDDGAVLDYKLSH